MILKIKQKSLKFDIEFSYIKVMSLEVCDLSYQNIFPFKIEYSEFKIQSSRFW